jgi:hypothetical protein
MTTFRKALLSFTLASGVAVSAQAAEISVCPKGIPTPATSATVHATLFGAGAFTTPPPTPVGYSALPKIAKAQCLPNGTGNDIVITGDFAKGDAEKFKTMLSLMPKDKPTVVFLDSNHGGPLVEGIQIGAAIHDADARTVVSNYCYSSCAMAWLGGTIRGIVGNAQVGFHAAYSEVPGEDPKVAFPACALMGYYIARVGLGMDVAAFAAEKGPDEVNIVTPEVAKQINLPTKLF